MKESRIDLSYLEQGEDNKLRYPKSLRVDLFGEIAQTIRNIAPDVYAYLCMEEKHLWEEVFGFAYKNNQEFEKNMLNAIQQKLL